MLKRVELLLEKITSSIGNEFTNSTTEKALLMNIY